MILKVFNSQLELWMFNEINAEDFFLLIINLHLKSNYVYVDALA
jgi:hypothetical protein